jgi:DNA-binding GntR family transcriptional regulator
MIFSDIVNCRQSAICTVCSFCMKPIEKRSIESRATSALRAEIMNGRFEPGERLTEMQLAGQLAVSRATVRTALHHLVGEGLIVQVPYTGWVVAELTPKDAWELFTLRAAMEGLAAKLATERLSPDGKTQLGAALDGLSRAVATGSGKRTAEADFEFHRVIVELAEHQRLARQYQLVEQQVRLSIASSNALLPDLRTVLEQHQPIADAILSSRPQQAAKLSEQHALSEGEKLVDHLEKLEKRKSGTSKA